jgi:hypothetical protein
MGRCYDAAPMGDLAERIRIRILPALLTALGVAGLAAGLFSLTSPVAADPLPSAFPTSSSTPTTGPTLPPTPSPLITFPPIPSETAPSASPSAPSDRVATRVRVAALEIDLPVIKQPDPDVVPCDVAMYFLYPGDPRLAQPGSGLATYLYAHAQAGMFLPLLDESRVQNGKSMLGMVVEVWTSDNQRFLYEITEVRRHVPYDEAFVAALNAGREELWLQTSEGRGLQPKLQVVAPPISQEAADPTEAHPEPRPRTCG